MRRVVSLWLPTWPTDRLRREKAGTAPPLDEPLVMVSREGQVRVLIAIDAVAATLGLRPGLPLAQARARVPGLHIADSNPAADAAGLDRIALWCLRRYSPLVAPTPPDGIWIDATGAAHLVGGEQPLLDELVTRMRQAGVTARAALADTPGAAHAVARFGKATPMVVPTGRTAAPGGGDPRHDELRRCLA